MPRGDKSAYTEKQKRQAEHIEESEMDRGLSRESAERIAWATVNKQDGGGKLSGSGRKDAKKAACQTIREDGAFIEAGENDTLIVQKLEGDKNAVGIFGFSFLEGRAAKSCRSGPVAA